METSKIKPEVIKINGKNQGLTLKQVCHLCAQYYSFKLSHSYLENFPGFRDKCEGHVSRKHNFVNERAA